MNLISIIIYLAVAFSEEPKRLRSYTPVEFIVTQSGDTAYAVYDTIVYKKYVIR